MQIDQLFEFVYILIDKRHVTAKEMAERFGVSTRTVYRWVETLSVAGVPVYALKGRGGGIAVSEQYTLDKTVLSEEEKLSIVSSVKALGNLSGKFPGAEDVDSRAAEKLSHLVKNDTDWLKVDFAPWRPEGQGVRELFGTLRDSILKKRQVTFDYFAGDGSTERRTVHPWTLVFKGQAWYLHAWCTARNAERFFKLSRMRNVTMTGRVADIARRTSGSCGAAEVAMAVTEVVQKGQKRGAGGQPSREPARPQKTGGQSQKPYGQPTLVTITAKFAASKVSYLFDSFVCSDVKPAGNGSITATFSVPDEEWVPGLLLSFGPDMEIISPEAMREKVRHEAEAVAKIYK